MKIINDKLRISAVVSWENMEEDLSITRNVNIDSLISLWRDRCSFDFFKENPSVDDVLVLTFNGEKRVLRWVCSAETYHNVWIDQSCEVTREQRRWLDAIKNNLKYP